MGSGRTEEKGVIKDKEISGQLTLICYLKAREQKGNRFLSKDHTHQL